MPHASIANRRRINLQKLTPDGLVIWSRNIMLANWPLRRNYETVTDCCDNDHTAAGSKLRSNSGLEVQATDDGGCLLIVERAVLSGESYQPCRAAIVRIDNCGCVLWERHYGSGHDYTIPPIVAGSTSGGWPLAVADVSFGGFKGDGYGRAAVIDDQVFVALESSEFNGSGPAPPITATRIIERLNLASGEVLSYTKLASWPSALCGPCVPNAVDGGAVITRLTSSNTLQNFYGPDGVLIYERGTKPPFVWWNPLGMTSIIQLGVCSLGVICDEMFGATWAGLTIRDLTPSDTPATTPDPGVIASTYATLANTRHLAACADASDQIYAASHNDSPRFPTTTGLRRLSVSGSAINEDWFVDGDLTFNRLVADSTGVYAVGRLGTAGSTFGAWKHSAADGSLLWYYATPLHSDGAFDPKSICLATDGNLFICGDESQF